MPHRMLETLKRIRLLGTDARSSVWINPGEAETCIAAGMAIREEDGSYRLTEEGRKTLGN